MAEGITVYFLPRAYQTRFKCQCIRIIVIEM